MQILSTHKTFSNLHISVPIGSKSAITFLNDLLWFIDPDRESDWGDHWVVLDDYEFIYVPLDIPCGGTIMRTMVMIMTIMTYYALSQWKKLTCRMICTMQTMIMIIWYFQQHTNRARDDRPPHHLPLLSRWRRNCSRLSFKKTYNLSFITILLHLCFGDLLPPKLQRRGLVF